MNPKFKKIFDQFATDDKFLIKVRNTVRYIIKCNKRRPETVKDDGSKEISDNETKRSPLKGNRIRPRQGFPFETLKMSLLDNNLNAT